MLGLPGCSRTAASALEKGGGKVWFPIRTERVVGHRLLRRARLCVGRVQGELRVARGVGRETALAIASSGSRRSWSSEMCKRPLSGFGLKWKPASGRARRRGRKNAGRLAPPSEERRRSIRGAGGARWSQFEPNCRLRGGSFNNNSNHLTCGNDNNDYRNNANDNVGFRCCSPGWQ